jgi:hypothetical protein
LPVVYSVLPVVASAAAYVPTVTATVAVFVPDLTVTVDVPAFTPTILPFVVLPVAVAIVALAEVHVAVAPPPISETGAEPSALPVSSTPTKTFVGKTVMSEPPVVGVPAGEELLHAAAAEPKIMTTKAIERDVDDKDMRTPSVGGGPRMLHGSKAAALLHPKITGL